MAYQGFDKAPAISEQVAKEMWSGTPFYFYGFYLGGPCYMSSDRNDDNSSKSFTKEKRDLYEEIGFKLGYIYVGRYDNCNTPSSIEKAQELGKKDAEEAINFAKKVDVPSLKVIYLDVEGGTCSDEVLEYVKTWVEYINGGNSPYWAGVYCSGAIMKKIKEAINSKANIWVARWQCNSGKSYDEDNSTCFETSCSNPAHINYVDIDNGACIRQYSGNVYYKKNSDSTCLLVDLDISEDKDPGKKMF